MTVLLEVKNLIKKYRNVAAVNDVSFSIGQGSCFGLLGPNGAGKTTVLEVIEDIIESTSGEVLYKSRPRSASFREEVGIQFQQTALLNFLTVQETLQTFQSLYQNAYEISELIQLCNLSEIVSQYNDKISGGQRQRLFLALALINRPELLFLDEPSTGLDPQARRNLWDIIQNVKAEGRTIVLTTHSMEEAEYLCDEIAIMDYGKIIAHGSPVELIKRYCREVSVIVPRRSFISPLEGLDMTYHEGKDQVEIKADNVNSCLERLIELDVDLKDMTIHSPNLEDVFLNLTGRQLRK